MATHELGGGLQYRAEPRNGGTWIALSGHISEIADFNVLKKMPGPLVLDLAEISRINSLGVREWIHFVRDLETTGMNVTFERCSPMIVNQMSMISNFMGSRSRIKSVLIPYFCPSCDAESEQPLEIAPGSEIQPSMPCPKCKSAMELDDLVDAYAALLQKA